MIIRTLIFVITHKYTIMEQIDPFKEFLQKKKEEEGKDKIDWEERKSNWLTSIDSLYHNIKGWLNAFEDDGLIRVRDDKEITLNEEYIGPYQTRRLDIYLGNDIISLTPKGTLIIGSYGRIDMRGPKGEILIIQPEWGDWKFAMRTPKLETWNVNAESFKKTIQDIV